MEDYVRDLTRAGDRNSSKNRRTHCIIEIVRQNKRALCRTKEQADYSLAYMLAVAARGECDAGAVRAGSPTSVDPSPAEHARISHLSQMLSVSAAKPTPAKTVAMVPAE
jgi:2-methylcitrate dehydratase PrpD